MFYIFLAIAVIFGIIYLIKISKSKNLLKKAVEAMDQGDDKTAVSIFKQAMQFSNETPAREREIINHLKAIYEKHSIEFDFSDYKKLMSQFSALSGKSSMKAQKEMKEVIKLKSQIVESLPDL